jgi:hypothetical protein
LPHERRETTLALGKGLAFAHAFPILIYDNV